MISYNEPRQTFVRPIIDGIALDEITSSNNNEKTDTAAESSPVLLTILRESDTREALETISTLPNARRSDPLGRPGEQLYGSRFIGDRTYLVTFRVTDPLYVLDLSNPADPFIAGELKISGYSDYLHPVSETLLLGIGKEAIPAEGAFPGDFGGAWYQGIKLSLIDVSDPANPSEADKIEIGKRGSQSVALREHHAITTLKQGDRLRIALPVEVHDTPSPYGNPDKPEHYWDYSHTGLYRFDIDIPNRRIDTTLKPLLVSNRNSSSIRSTHGDRSAIIGDHVHYLHAGRFWSQHWTSNVVRGPE